MPSDAHLDVIKSRGVVVKSREVVIRAREGRVSCPAMPTWVVSWGRSGAGGDYKVTGE